MNNNMGNNSNTNDNSNNNKYHDICMILVNSSI